MVHMLVSTLGLVSGIWAHGEVQLSDTAVELQQVRYANDRIITAYEGMPPSDFADELQILQRRLGSSLEDLPELWIPATKLLWCLTSYARELEVDLIPSLADVSQEEGDSTQIETRVRNAATTCASQWEDERFKVHTGVVPFFPWPVPQLLPHWLFSGCYVWALVALVLVIRAPVLVWVKAKMFQAIDAHPDQPDATQEIDHPVHPNATQEINHSTQPDGTQEIDSCIAQPSSLMNSIQPDATVLATSRRNRAPHTQSPRSRTSMADAGV